MCGIGGILLKKKMNKDIFRRELKKMSDSMIHRGPDNGGYWIDDNLRCGFCHRRLSIIDLSIQGAQPMVSQTGRHVISFNGEIYNHLKLRKELEQKGKKLKGFSDTEALLEHLEMFGLENTLKKVVGMFAFSVYDKKFKKIFIVRDRIGIKPVYYGLIGEDKLVFASELKAIMSLSSFKNSIDRDSISNYMRHGYIPTPNTIYKNIFKLEPGNFLSISLESLKISKKAYWSPQYQNYNSFYQSSEPEIINKLEEILDEAIKIRMVADVPVGAFLSGGIDSSAVAALMQKSSSRKIKTFSIGFKENNFNEAEYAKKVAKHLGTDHHEYYLTAKESQNFIKQIPFFFDEPFADSSQIPTLLLSKVTRKNVKVALSGDGGDEIFAGYNRYVQAKRISHLLNLPTFIKNIISMLIKTLPPSSWNNILNFKIFPNQMGDKLYKINKLFSGNKDQFYRSLISCWDDPEEIVKKSNERKGLIWDENFKNKIPNFVSRMQILDLLTYLPDDILTKVDRSTMAVSLEGRVPLLDHRVVEFCSRLPSNLKFRNGKSKWALRKILYKYVPRNLIDRPKMGFGVPIDDWLRGDLKKWGQHLLSKKIFNRHDFLKRDLIIEKWDEHQSGKRNWQYHLWYVLMLHSWAEMYN